MGSRGFFLGVACAILNTQRGLQPRTTRGRVRAIDSTWAFTFADSRK